MRLGSIFSNISALIQVENLNGNVITLYHLSVSGAEKFLFIWTDNAEQTEPVKFDIL